MSKGVAFHDNQGPVTVLNEQKTPRASILGKLIEIIATSEHDALNLDRIPSEIDTKIQFNDLDGYRWLIDEYVNSSLLIDESIKELNQTVLNGSTKLKRQMRLFYNRSLEKHSISTRPFDLPKLKLHSDHVVKDVIDMVTGFVKSSADLKSGYYEEDIEYGVSLITSYSIIECIVLENPNDHD
ncbi:hypothetical protein AYI74_13600 [Shewanella algae]|uniref:hypothetical protein n=1 Tax=Shewanella algae TaxID=38313 RepID=UPI0011B6D99D|nr:hypothetical protein [Shewanella algae]TWU67803.1 hypothetical protein AYI74_13600 [Shewanella algae]